MLLYAGALPDLYAINIVRIGSATESVHGGGVVFREACGNKRFIRCVLPPDIPGGDYDNAEHTAGSDFQDQLHLKGSPWRAGGRGQLDRVHDAAYPGIGEDFVNPVAAGRQAGDGDPVLM